MHCLPQMSGYIKYFESDGKIMPFIVKDDNVLDVELNLDSDDSDDSNSK